MFALCCAVLRCFISALRCRGIFVGSSSVDARVGSEGLGHAVRRWSVILCHGVVYRNDCTDSMFQEIRPGTSIFSATEMFDVSAGIGLLPCGRC